MNYIIFDLEATCWDSGNKKLNEIIEIGAVKLSSNLELVDKFSGFVKPEINPVLLRFCKKLTSISQQDVDNGKVFIATINEFEEWILSTGDS